MQRSFVSDVSHELRTPVTTMRMAADMLSMHKDEYDATTKRTVELLDGQIRRFQEMLADLLEISRFDAGYAALDLVEADIREPIEQSVEAISAIAQTKHVPLDVHMPNVEVLVRIDTRRISRVVRNLLANAIDFAEGKPVEVRLAANQRMVVISVRDYGVGMTSESVPECSTGSGGRILPERALPEEPVWACPSYWLTRNCIMVMLRCDRGWVKEHGFW